MSTDARTRLMRTTHVTPALMAALLATATAVTVAIPLDTPAAAAMPSDTPDRCGPATSSVDSDFVDRITFRKEQMSRDRAVRPR